jgi:YidC/Oxa1 family membrane protein insertase
MRNNIIFFVLTSVAVLALWFYFAGPFSQTTPDPNKVAQNDGKDKDAGAKDKKEDAKDKKADGKDGKDKIVEPKDVVKKDDEKDKKVEPKDVVKKDDEKDKKVEPKDVVKKDGEKDKKVEPKDVVKKDDEKDKKDDKGQKPVAAAPLPKAKTLGGPGFHLTMEVTERGGGVRKVVLNQFEAADWRGRPCTPPRKLELIQEDDIHPSYLFFHYENAKDKNPLDTLGYEFWTVGERKELKGSGDEIYHEVQVWTELIKDLKITKTYRLAPKDYHVTLIVELEDKRTDKKALPIQFRYQMSGAHGLPIEGEWYASIARNAIMAMVDPTNDSVWRKLEDSNRISLRKGGDRFPEASRDKYRIQYAGVVNQYFGAMIAVDEKQAPGVNRDEIIAWTRPTVETTEIKGTVVGIKGDKLEYWDSTSKQTFTYHMLPRVQRHVTDLNLQVNDSATLSYYQTPTGKLIASWVRVGELVKPQFDDITVRVNTESITINPGDTVKHQYVLYHGPVKAMLLAQFSGEKAVPGETVDRYTHTLELRTLTDYHMDNWLGTISSKIFLTDLIILFTRLMHWLLHYLHMALSWIPGSYGLSIFVLTIIVRACMFPISRRQALFSIKMQELQPQLNEITKKYENDPQAKMQATQEFYRKHGINPLGSCWPMLLQLPIFMGLYFSLQESVHFRLADFLWIKSLSAPDMCFYWSEQIPVLSTPDTQSGFWGFFYLGPYFNILPILAVTGMMYQQMQTMAPPTTDEQATQQKMMRFMSIVMGIMFYKVAAGLCIYFITSSLWGLAERKLLPKKQTTPVETATATPAAAPSPPAGQQKWSKKKEKDQKKDKDEPASTFDKIKALWKEILKQAEKK